MKPGFLPVTALVVLAVAAPLPGAGAHHDGRDVIPWNLIDCQFMFATALARADVVREHLAPGFDVAVVSSPPGIGDQVLLIFEAEQCAEGAGLDGQVPDMQYAIVSTRVIPPYDLLVPGYAGWYYHSFFVLTPDEPRRSFLQAHGHDARDGSVVMTDRLPDPSTLARSSVAVIDGLGPFAIASAGRLVPFDISGSFIDLDPAAPGTVVMKRTDWATDGFFANRGTVTAPPGSWMAAALMAPVMNANVIFGTWSYTDGSMTVPVPYGA